MTHFDLILTWLLMRTCEWQNYSIGLYLLI